MTQSQIFQISIITWAIVAFIATDSHACPCGCGAVNPQVLNPGERGRVFTSMTRDSHFQTVTNKGGLGVDAGPEAKNTITFAYATALNNDLSASVSLPYEQNVHEHERSDSALSDPSISLRYVVLPQNFVEPFIPQIQTFLTYKHSFSRSIYDSKKDSQMDVHGNGFNEIVSGLDFWFGVNDIKAGLTQTAIIPLAREIDSFSGRSVLEPGWGQKTLLVAGYNYPGIWQVLGGIERETRQQLKLGAETIADSDKEVNSALVTFSYGIASQRTLGLSYKRTASLGKNKNTTRSDGATISLMQAF